MNKSLLILIAGLGLLSSCAHRQETDTKPFVPHPDQTMNLDETKVIEIARQAVAANDTWVDRAEFERPKREADGSWSVLVWRLPKTPGGHRIIWINKEGRVTKYLRGA